MLADCGLSIRSANGTIYFTKDGQALKQAYDLTVANPGPPVDAEITLWTGGRSCSCSVHPIEHGVSTVRVCIPDIREPADLTFDIAVEGSEGLTMRHLPHRHWTVHLIQFAHHDFGYTDLPSNILEEYCGFYDDVLRFCRETDGFPEESRFRYTIEQGWSLLYYMEHRPETVCREMASRIREGRVEVNAFLGNEITELLGPEEMARLLYPVAELKRKYNFPVLSAEHNDIPGISWGVAAAMVGAGIKWFAPALPDYFRWHDRNIHTFWDEEKIAPNGLPQAFYWQAPDGERILFWYGRQGAGGQIDVSLSSLPSELERLEESGYPYDVFRYLTMGGMRDNSPPRVEFAETCRQWNEKWAYPRFVQSTNRMFFPSLERRLGDVPTYRGELPGTDYSSAANCTAYPSSLNRVAHDQLLAAERFAAIASKIAGYEYPAEAIKEAYYCTLMNDEHAWGLAHPTGPGQEACIAQHCEFAYRAAALAHDVLTKAVNQLADQIDREEDAFYAVVFNPLGRARTDIATAPAKPFDPCSRPMKPLLGRREWEGKPAPLVNCSVSNRDLFQIPEEWFGGELAVTDLATGQPVPHEVYEVPSPQAPVPYAAYRYSMGQFWPNEKRELRFLATDVPPLGYKVYRISPTGRKIVRETVKIGENWLENRFYRVELDPRTGAIMSIFDKDLGRELIDRRAKHKANQLVIRSSISGEVHTSGKARIVSGRKGAVSGSLMVTTEAPGYPQVTQEIILCADTKRIDIGNRLLKDSSAMLETFIAFPFAFNEPQFRYEGSLSIIEPLVDQFPGSNSEYHAVQHWANVSDGNAGVTLASMDAPMMQFGGNWELYISQAHHGFTPPGFDHPFHTKEDVTKGHIYSFVLLNNYTTNFSPTQNGEVLFRYAITSHKGEWDACRATDFGYEASLPLVCTYLRGAHQGDLPNSSSFARIEPTNVLLLALKRAEDGRGTIVRLMETGGRDVEAAISLPFLKFSGAALANLVEEDQSPLVAFAGTVTVPVRAWGTATVRLF